MKTGFYPGPAFAVRVYGSSMAADVDSGLTRQVEVLLHMFGPTSPDVGLFARVQSNHKNDSK